MEKPAEGEFDTLNTWEAAVVATGLAKGQKSKANHVDTEHMGGTVAVPPGDLLNLLHLKDAWKHIQVLSRLLQPLKHVDDTQ